MDTDDSSTFASLLKEYRVAQRLSQEALAERAGLSRAAINLLERGRRLSPRRDTVSLLAKTLKLSLRERARLLAAAARGAGAVGATRATSGPPSSLPLRLTSFIGREKETAEVQALLRSKRLVTLTGAGGIGKTSLALEVAAAAQAHFADGVALAELAALTDEELVPHAIAAVLGVRERPAEAILITLGTALGMTQRLLVLDTCEHLVLSCARVAEALLQTCPRLRILATSREPLRVGAEVIWRVPALALPDHDAQPPDELATSEAVRLFVERAETVRPGFALSAGNGAAVAEICRQLDGIPLAIELAAARVAVLMPAQIAQYLSDRFRLLTTGSRTAVPRHRTLRALIDWSYDLLSEPERILFRRLAVFAGGWSLEAAEIVCGEADVLDLLTGLVDKSLVQVEEQDGETRFTILDTIRAYAWEQLGAGGEARELQQRHACWALELAETARPAVLSEAHLQGWLRRLDQEHDNLRAALRWSREAGEVERALRLAGALWLFWQIRDHCVEGKGQIDSVLALPGVAAYPAAWAAARRGAGKMAYHLGDLPTARAHLESVVAHYRGSGDDQGLGHALVSLGEVARDQGDVARAAAWIEEAVTVYRAVSDSDETAYALFQLGTARRAQGDALGARALLEESLALYRESGITEWLISLVIESLGRVAEDLGDDSQAGSYYREAMSYFGRVEARGDVASLLKDFATLAAGARQPARALRLIGAAARLREEIGTPVPPIMPERSTQTLDLARGQLATDVADAELAAGRAMTLHEAVAYALADDGDADLGDVLSSPGNQSAR